MPPRRNNSNTRPNITPHNPWKHPVTTPYATIIAEHKTTFRDVEMTGEHEHLIHRPINTVLTYQALTQSQKMSGTGRFLTIGPQGPLFAHGRPTPISAAGSSTIEYNVKRRRRPRAATRPKDDDPDSSSSSESSAPVNVPKLRPGQYGNRLHEYEASSDEEDENEDENEGEDEHDDEDKDDDEEDDEDYNEDDDEDDEDTEDEDEDDDDEDISAREGVSSNPSAPITQPPSSTRFVDFNIYVNIINSNIPGVLACVVEVKPFPFDKIEQGMTPIEAIYQAMDDMLPQVVQQVQYAFHQYCELQEMHALLFVSAYCRFLKFKRNKVPDLPHVDDIPEDGFKFDETQRRRKINKIAERGGRHIVFRLFKGNDYDTAFKRGITRIVRFATNIAMPQPQQ